MAEVEAEAVAAEVAKVKEAAAAVVEKEQPVMKARS